jgi:ketosteroid isomerase-like protein
MKRSALLLCAVLALPQLAIAGTEDEVRSVFNAFVAGQNAHDLKAVSNTLRDSENLLWVTRGVAIWGRPAALKRFETLYQGTWKLEPEAGALKVVMLSPDTAQVFVPIVFTMGAPGQTAQTTRVLMNQVLVKTAAGWRISSILPIPVPGT